MNFFITELRLFQDFRLELELDEFLDPLSCRRILGPFS